MTERTPDEEEQLLHDVVELIRAMEQDYPEGPYGVWTPDTGWIMSDPGEGEKAFRERIRKEETP